jgi:Tfp pilus assembly protein PilO
MTPLMRRLVAEKQSIVITLGAAILANILAYALIVYPLGVKSAGAADRAAAAAQARQAAERELEVARALVTGKARAEQELSSFYQKVLPADQAAALNLTYSTLPALARRSDVEYLSRTYTPEEVEGNRQLERLKIHVALQGDYRAIRDFIYELESAPQFVIIDDVTLAATSGTDIQTLQVNLSTYYRVKGNGA